MTIEEKQLGDKGRAELPAALTTLPKVLSTYCVECGKTVYVIRGSNEELGVFNVFCSGDCEDRYAAKM